MHIMWGVPSFVQGPASELLPSPTLQIRGSAGGGHEAAEQAGGHDGQRHGPVTIPDLGRMCREDERGVQPGLHGQDRWALHASVAVQQEALRRRLLHDDFVGRHEELGAWNNQCK